MECVVECEQVYLAMREAEKLFALDAIRSTEARFM